jgi:hypothetical protein
MGVHPSIDSTIIPLTAVLVPNKLGALWAAIARTLFNTSPRSIALFTRSSIKKKLKMNKAPHFISYVAVENKESIHILHENGEWKSRTNRELEEMSKGENVVK